MKLAGHHVPVKSSMFDLGYFATPVVPEVAGEGMRKNPSLGSSKALTRSTQTLV
jgi:hypothetical protein